MPHFSPSSPSSEKSQWRLRYLLGWHLLAALLISSLLLPFTKGYWEIIDVAFFKWINGSLANRPNWQIFWALANHSIADWVEDLFFLSFFLIYIFKGSRTLRWNRTVEILFCILFAAAIIYFVNRVLFRQFLEIPRLSPTRVIDSCIRLSQHIPWLHIKDGASKSFPGDHGTTAILFAVCYSYLTRSWLRFTACLYAAFLCMPRLITGAHWLSDILVGSGSIAMVCLSWAFCTPLFNSFVDRLSSLKKEKVPLSS